MKKSQTARSVDQGEQMDTVSLAIKTLMQKQPDIFFKLDEPLCHYTTFNIGGPVRAMFFPKNPTCLIEICNVLDDHSLTPLILGNGSNILAYDEKLDLVVINTSELNSSSLLPSKKHIAQEYEDITVDAGTLLSKAAVFACNHGLTGLEFAHGIPGTIGGAVVMNAGAYGEEMKDIVHGTTAFNVKTGVFTLTTAENEFSYRHSRFSEGNDIVLSTVLRLKKGDKKLIKQKMDELGARRRDSQPLDLQSGGSTFKRPGNGYAAALIEQAGLKGYTIGGAQVSVKHSGFIVNTGNASFSDVTTLIVHVQHEVLKQFSIKLEPEIKIIK
jgi:UDP-N-acetylmuramate dehydrogenase